MADSLGRLDSRPLYLSQVLIEPIQYLFDKLVPREEMAGFIDHLSLSTGRCAQQLEHRQLRGLIGEVIIESAIEHKDRNLYAADKVDGVDFRKSFVERKARHI